MQKRLPLKIFALSVCSILLIGCDKDAEITFYDKSLKSNKISCLSFIPKDNPLDKELTKLYNFNQNCPYRLELSYKSNIVCNSPYNAPQKATTEFPNAFITLEVKKGFSLEYSYYKDLTHKPTIDDLKDGFKKLKEDILKN